MSNPIPEDNLSYLLQEKERLDGQYDPQFFTVALGRL